MVDAGKPLPPAPSPPKPAERDDWDRALASLESEFQGGMKRPEERNPSPGEPATPVAGPGPSTAKALVATQDLRLEVDRLREELELREQALEMFQQLKEEGELGDLLGTPKEHAEDRKKLAKLEDSLAAAQEAAADRGAAVEALRAQLDAAQTQLKSALGALASQMPVPKGGSTDDSGPIPPSLQTALAKAIAVPSFDEPKDAGPRVIRRHAPPPPGSAADRSMLAPVEVFGPDRLLIGSAAFALGEGEALELFLSTLYNQWRGLGKSFETRVAPDGIHVGLADDPENRKVSILTSGSYIVHVGASEADRVRALLLGPANPGGTA